MTDVKAGRADTLINLRRRDILAAGSAATLALAALSPGFAQARRESEAGLRLLTSWYPEQWPREGWRAELAFMRRAGIGIVRMGEFAWSRMEPSEGHYDFAWVDEAIAAAAASGIAVVLGTPTAAPPSWLTQRYPETLRINADGKPAVHGGRRHFSFINPTYRAKARGIAAAMARRYGRDPRVIGWQIDNEVGALDYGDTAESAFRLWLKARYGTLASLNTAWDGAVWSQDYSDWNAIRIPRSVSGSGQNPGLLLAWDRFCSATWVDYQQNQIDALRPHLAASQFITTNFTGHWSTPDQAILAKPLDRVTWDWYFDSAHVDPFEGALLHDMNRGFKRQNVWVMEAASGTGAWAKVNAVLDPGELRAMAWQAVSQGAEVFGFWAWRAALGGQEQLHGVILGADGLPAPLFDEVARIGREFALAGNAVAGTAPTANIAMLHDFASRWALDEKPFHADFDAFALSISWRRALDDRAAAIDVVPYDAPFEAYALIAAPSLALLDDKTAARLIAFVKRGGWLALGPRSGFKDNEAKVLPTRGPGPLSPLLGAGVEQYYALERPVAVTGTLGAGYAVHWGERIETADPACEVLARWGAGHDWLTGHPAIVARRHGAGGILYVGGDMDAPILARAAAWVTARAGITAPPALPPGVQFRTRQGGRGPVDFYINWSKASVTLPLPTPRRDLLVESRTPVRSVSLAPYGVAVLGSV